MAVTLYHVGRTPQSTQFGLDTFTEHYKANDAADVVLLDSGVPQRGDAHPDYAQMFVTERYITETGPSSSALDVTYMGTMTGEMPPSQEEDSDAVQSASSSKGVDGTILTSPITVEFYAPTKRLNFITYGAKGSLGTVADPTDEIRIIKVTAGDTSYAPTGALGDIVANFFTQQIVDTMSSPEIVSGQFWQNAEVKTKTLTGWIFSVESGDYIIMFAPGQGYTVGNSLTMTDGSHTAVITVDSVGIGNSVLGFHATSNTFDYTTLGIGPIYTSGGSGSGAAFYNYHIP